MPPAEVSDTRPPCDCARCRRARRRPLRCRVCGYRGEPSVYPCECAPFGVPDNLASYGQELCEAEVRGHEGRARALREAIAALLTDGRMPMCGINGRPVGCCHGDRTCPICQATAGDSRSLEWTDPDRAFHAWDLIRAIRALVAEGDAPHRRRRRVAR